MLCEVIDRSAKHKAIEKVFIDSKASFFRNTLTERID